MILNVFRAWCFLIVFLIINEKAYPYDDEITHRQLTDYAIENSKLNNLLTYDLRLEKGITTSIDSNKTVKYLLMEGSKVEDTPNCRAASHFLNPLKEWDVAGVSDTTETISGYIPDAWCFATDLFSSRFSTHKYSNVTWATGYTSSSIISLQPIVTDNGMDWNAARSYYYMALTATNDNAREEYFAQTFQTLGQVLHLLQDMAVPAHVRNDFTA